MSRLADHITRRVQNSLLLMLLPWFMLGCASIIGSTDQPISVAAICDGSPMPAAECTLSNNKGSWYLLTPGIAVIHKSYGDLAVVCKKGEATSSGIFQSKSNGAVWGNIIVGGVIGYAVDASRGAGFDYPSTMTVVFNQPCPLNLAAAPAGIATDIRPRRGFVATQPATAVIRDGFSGNEQKILLAPANVVDLGRRWNTGDEVGMDGRVTSLRLGRLTAVLREGNLWTLPLKPGASGSAVVEFADLAARGRMDWKVTTRQGARTNIEARFSYTGSEQGRASMQMVGDWLASYADGIALPVSYELNLRSASPMLSDAVGPERSLGRLEY